MPQKPSEFLDADINLRKQLGPCAAAVETSLMAMLIIDSGFSTFPIIYANAAFLTLTGFARAAVAGMPVNVILSNDAAPDIVALIQEAVSADSAGTWQAQCQCADKSEFRAAVYLSPLRGNGGLAKKALLSIVRCGDCDKTTLSHQNPLYALYEKAPGFIATSEGPDHHFTFVNASYKRFVGRDALIGFTVAEALPEVVEQGVISILDEVYRTGEPFLGSDMPMKILNPESGVLESRRIDVVYQPVRDTSGRITGLFCEGYDVTAKHQAHEALTALQSEMIHVSRINAMGMMAATLAHELRQPLSAIVNYTAGIRMLEPTANLAGRLVEALQGIDEAAQRAAGVVQHLRELTGRRKPAQTAFDLKLAVEECVRLVRASTSPEIKFDVQVADVMTLTADRIQLQQVIINLLLNAAAATMHSDRRLVTIIACRQDGTVKVSVADTGTGVTREVAESIFTWSHSSKIDGMGLGLSICRTILEMHGGRIWLEKTDADGSEFSFMVPDLGDRFR